MTRRGHKPVAEIQCAWCGNLRAEGGSFVPGPREGRLDGDRSHGICPACLRRELGRALEEAGVPG